MKNSTFLDLDGHLLRFLIHLTEEESLTRAAENLGVTQSAASHMLTRLRAIVGDPVVVKSGRGVVPTVHARELAEKARALLDELRSFAFATDFHPEQQSGQLTIAADDLQRDLLLPTLLKRLKQEAPKLTLRVIPSGIPNLEMFRSNQCVLAISPRPPVATEIMQKRLFTDRYLVFFDGSQRAAPASLAEYSAAEHVTVSYTSTQHLEIDRHLEDLGIERRFGVEVSSFAGIPAFIHGTGRIATLPSLLRHDLLKDLQYCELPLSSPPLPIYMIWHARYQHDPAHVWLRQHLDAVTQDL
ncbi:MAG: LysR family transcriptional regulator [Pseudohongiellaceae bacterium]